MEGAQQFYDYVVGRFTESTIWPLPLGPENRQYYITSLEENSDLQGKIDTGNEFFNVNEYLVVRELSLQRVIKPTRVA
jgi:hypothetical protein